MRLALAFIRESHSMTQTQVAQQAKITQGYYSDIEGGLRCPSPEVAGRIAHVLKIAESDMFHVFYAGEQVYAARKRA